MNRRLGSMEAGRLERYCKKRVHNMNFTITAEKPIVAVMEGVQDIVHLVPIY